MRDILQRKGFNLVDCKGETVIDPYTVKWSKYSKGIPWKVMQGSGDDNALGIFKFNFNNPYSVYLHDTNQRYLFKNSSGIKPWLCTCSKLAGTCFLYCP